MTKLQFKPGQKIWIHSCEITSKIYGLSEKMKKYIETVQTVDSKTIYDPHRELEGISINYCTWSEEDLYHISPQQVRKIKTAEKKINEINTFCPRAPKWLIGADKLSSDISGCHRSNYGIYGTKEYDELNRFCFNKLANMIKSYHHDTKSLPSKILYKPNFENQELLNKHYLNGEEIQRWVILCKKYGMLPIYIDPHAFLKGEVIIEIDKKLCYNKLFFYLVNARYCDEHPDIPKMTIYFTDTVGLSFYVSYVLAHFITKAYDEEYCALPYVRHIKKRIKEYNSMYDEYVTKSVYHRPRPRDVMMWAMRVYAFANEYSGKAIAEYKDLPGGIPWHLQHSIRNLSQKWWEFSLEANNKTHNILKGFNPKTTKWRIKK